MTQWLERASAFEPTMKAWETALFNMPELGFKEVQTRKQLLEYAESFDLKLSADYGINGFAITIGQGKPHLGLIAEMDALVVPNHPKASEIDHAAHSCGHHLQGIIMLSALGLLKKEKTFKGSITLFFVAAEEYVDMAYRQNLREEGKITLYSGKQNLILQDAFRDLELMISCHTMGQTDQPSLELNSRLSGFIYKRLTFTGISAHAAVAPHQGVNALNAMVLTQNAIALLRETFQEKDMVRVHLMSTLGGQSANAVPSKAVLEGYVRSIDPEVLSEINAKIDRAALHCSQALGAQCEILDQVGYQPLLQSEALSDVIRPYAESLVGIRGVKDHQKSFASGDIGDISLMLPTVQFGFSGCSGVVHGADFCMADSQEALVMPVTLILQTLDDLLDHPDKVEAIKADFKPSMTLTQFKTMHQLD
jgi:amidohydrolase